MRELSEASELIREREDLNDVGPKVVETGSTGQTGPSDRPDQNLESLARQKSPTNSKTLLGTRSGIHLDVFD